MRKIFFFILVAIIFIYGCEIQEDLSKVDVGKIYNYDFPNDIEVEDLGDVLAYVASNMRWVSDPLSYGGEYIQTPEETYNRKDDNGYMLGDCDDFSGMFAYLAERVGVDCEMVFAKLWGGLHVFCYLPREGRYIEPQRGGYISNEDIENYYTIYFHIPYEEWIWMAVNYHEMVGKYLR
jgi:hypothetical protein